MKKLLILIQIIPILFLNAQWVKTNGPIGGKVRSFASDGIDLFVTLGGGGIHGSFDNGYNWEGKNNGLLSSDVKVIVYKDSILFTGTDEGVYRSYDKGDTWEPVFNGLRDTYVKSMTVMGNSIYAGTYVHGIFRSTDNGDSWQNVYTPGAKYIYFMENNGTRIFAATYGDGMLVSDDGGDTWQVKNNGLNDLGILTVYVEGDLVIVSTYPGIHYRSFDAGDTWAGLSLPYGHSKEMVKLDSYIYSAFWGNGVYRSDDNGSTWSARNTGLAGTSIWAMEKNGNSLFVGYDSGDIYRTDNYGSNWSISSTGLVKGAYVGSLEAVVALPEYPQEANKIIACTHGSNLFNSNDEGSTWTKISVGTVEIRSITSVSRTVVIGTDMLGLFLSGNTSGDTYVAKNNGLGSKWIQSIIVTDRLKGELFCGTGEAGIYFTDNGCDSWTARNNGLTTGYVKSIVGGDPEMFIGTGDGGVFYSDDYASSWSPRNNGLPTDWIETLLLKDSLIFAGTGDAGVYVSSDKGLNWSAVNNGLNDSLYVRNILDYNGMLIACSKPLGVFYSIDNGGTWKEFNSGLDNTYIASLEIYDGNLYAGSIGDGVYIRPLSDLEILGTPVNLTITGNILNWDTVSNASYYRIYRSETPYSGFIEIDTSTVNSFEDTDTAGNKYFYRVTADNGKR
ncbi:MAG: hypothetical protein GQ534_12015 [Candidatus Delongbacteria bacterium]|nr:hypothetical protein [Candidatus Delongbacteria bacterium]